MQKTAEDVIKGLAYLSDEDKKRILEARGIEEPEVSAKTQRRNDREDARKAEEQAYITRQKEINRMWAPDMRPATIAPAMKLHIDIHAYGKNGDAFHLEGDVFSQDDLAAIHDRFKDYMPRRKLWGVL